MRDNRNVEHRSFAVAQIVESLTVGGAENLAVRVANKLMESGFESHLIVLGPPYDLMGRIAPGVRVHRAEARRGSIRNPIGFMASILRSRGILRGIIADHDIRLIQTHLPGANFLGLMLAFSSGIRVLPTVHNNKEFDYGDFDSRILRALRKAAYREMTVRCSGLIAVSAAVKASLVKELGLSPVGAATIHVMPNGVPVPEPLADSRRREVRAAIGVRDSSLFVLAAGRLTEQKNFRDGIRIARACREQGLDARFIMAGEGEQREELEEAIRAADLDGYVRLTGNLENLGEVMGAADLFLTTSLWEGLPLVMLEAMAWSLPVVGYDIDGINEIIDDGVHGRILPVGALDQVAESIGAMAVDKRQRELMGAASRELVSREYSLRSLVTRLSALYRELIGNVR